MERHVTLYLSSIPAPVFLPQYYTVWHSKTLFHWITAGHQLSACEIPLITFCKDRAVLTFESFSKSSADTDNKFEFVEITSWDCKYHINIIVSIVFKYGYECVLRATDQAYFIPMFLNKSKIGSTIFEGSRHGQFFIYKFTV